MIDTNYVREAGLEIERELTVPDVGLIRAETARRQRLRRSLAGCGAIMLVCVAGFALVGLLDRPQESELDTAASADTDGAIGSVPSTNVATTIHQPPGEESSLVLTPLGTFAPNGLFTISSLESDGIVGGYVTLEVWTGEGIWVDVVGLLVAAEIGGGAPRVVPLVQPLGGDDIGFKMATFQLPGDLEPGDYRVCLAPAGPECGTFKLVHGESGDVAPSADQQESPNNLYEPSDAMIGQVQLALGIDAASAVVRARLQLIASDLRPTLREMDFGYLALVIDDEGTGLVYSSSGDPDLIDKLLDVEVPAEIAVQQSEFSEAEIIAQIGEARTMATESGLERGEFTLSSSKFPAAVSISISADLVDALSRVESLEQATIGVVGPPITVDLEQRSRELLQEQQR